MAKKKTPSIITVMEKDGTTVQHAMNRKARRYLKDPKQKNPRIMPKIGKWV